jgi:hypothetical protein
MPGRLHNFLVMLHDVKLNYDQLISMKILCNFVQQSVVYHEFQFPPDDDKKLSKHVVHFLMWNVYNWKSVLMVFGNN